MATNDTKCIATNKEGDQKIMSFSYSYDLGKREFIIKNMAELFSW